MMNTIGMIENWFGIWRLFWQSGGFVVFVGPVRLGGEGRYDRPSPPNLTGPTKTTKPPLCQNNLQIPNQFSIMPIVFIIN